MGGNLGETCAHQATCGVSVPAEWPGAGTVVMGWGAIWQRLASNCRDGASIAATLLRCADPQPGQPCQTGPALCRRSPQGYRDGMAFKLRLKGRAQEVLANVRSDLSEGEGRNLDLYALQIISVSAMVWGFLANPILGIGLAALSLGVAETLRHRHARRNLETTFSEVESTVRELVASIRKLEQMMSDAEDAELVSFRERLKSARDDGPRRPRVK